MSFERVFTEEELRIGGLRSVDAIAEALDRGDAAAAVGFVKRLRFEVLSMLQNYDGWEVSLRRDIVKRDGEDAEREAMQEVENPAVAPERCLPAPEVNDRWRAAAREVRTLIEAGEAAKAMEAAQALHDEALARHDRGMSRVTALLSWIGRRHGPAGVEASLTRAMQIGMLGDAGFKERAEALMHFARVHLQPLGLTEDEEKLIFRCPVCPSGGRLLREGHYEAPRSGLVVKGPASITYGLEELPVYCCHEPAMEKASIEETGVPLFVIELSERLGQEPCLTYMYKDPADIPEKYYTRVGLEKPKH